MEADDFQGVVIPGGFMPDKLRRDAKVKDLVRKFAASGKLVAAICHGGWIPISAGVYKGVRVTGSPGIKDDLVNAGAIWEDAAVVVDRHFVSSRKPDDLPEFCRAIIEVMAGVAVRLARCRVESGRHDRLIPHRRRPAAGGARIGRGSGAAATRHGIRGGLQLRDAGGDFRLEAIHGERALVVGERLGVVARLIAQPAERRERPGVVRIDRQRFDELRLGLFGLAGFFEQPGELDLRLGRLRIRRGPTVEQSERFGLATRFR